MKINSDLNIAIICNSPLYQEVLSLWIDKIPGTRILGNSSNVEEFQSLQISDHTDILIMGYSTEETSDLELIKSVSEQYNDLRILVISMYNNPNFHRSLQRYGVKGCIEKYFISSEKIVTPARL